MRQRAEDAVKLPRYSVVLNVGARHEPWVADIKPLDAAARIDSCSRGLFHGSHFVGCGP